MKKQELRDVLENALKAMPTGVRVLPNGKPSDWSIGYYDGLRVCYKMFLDWLEKLED